VIDFAPSETEEPRPRPLPVQLQVEHPPWVRELAFVCWVKADRNASQAVKLLEESWPEEEPPRPVPYRTLAGWAQREQWDAKADQLIAETFPGLRMRQIAMLVHANTGHLKTLNDIAAGRYNDTEQHDPRAVRNMLEAAKTGLIAGGIGTFGSRDRVAPVLRAAPAEAINLEGMSELELNRITREAIKRSKSPLPERRR
jgi:hypothetical protein